MVLSTAEWKKVFPVLRSTAFPKCAAIGSAFLIRPHTAETAIYYGLDLGDRVHLLDESHVDSSLFVGLQEAALANLQALPFSYRKDVVAGNDFFFFSNRDGYDASRILLESFLAEFSEVFSGAVAVAVPHQDVLIVADVRNADGYDILARMTMQFYQRSPMPITALPFLYEAGRLEPIFVVRNGRL